MEKCFCVGLQRVMHASTKTSLLELYHYFDVMLRNNFFLKIYSGKCTQLVQLVYKYFAQIRKNRKNNPNNRIRNPNWQGATSWLTRVAEDLNSRQPKTNPASGQSGTRNHGPPYCESNVLTTQPCCLQTSVPTL